MMTLVIHELDDGFFFFCSFPFCMAGLHVLTINSFYGRSVCEPLNGRKVRSQRLKSLMTNSCIGPLSNVEFFLRFKAFAKKIFYTAAAHIVDRLSLPVYISYVSLSNFMNR